MPNYTIKVDESKGDLLDLVRWLRTNGVHRNHVRIGPFTEMPEFDNTPTYYPRVWRRGHKVTFKYEKDAIMFALRWS